MTVSLAPAHITRTPDHHYVFEGKTYPGVTSILGILDKSGPLMAWASRMTAEAAVAMVEVLPQLIATSGPDGAVKALTARSAWKNEEAKLLGTEVHNLADMLITGQPLPPMSPNALRRIELYEQWWRSAGWRLRVSEALLVSPKHGYGGTLDLLCYDRDGRTVLADIKTGNIDYRGQVYDSIILQLAAYGMVSWAESEGALYSMPKVDRYAVIHVTADEVREVEVNVGDAERQAFLDCLSLTRWKESVRGKRL